MSTAIISPNCSYEGERCVVSLEGIDLAEISMVRDPANPLATIHVGKWPEGYEL